MITFDYPDFTIDGTPFIPIVYDAGLGEPVPSGFNAVRIPLEGGLRSDLRWQAALDYAEKSASLGLKLLWDLDLGLFSRLLMPLSDETQFRALALAVHYLLERIREYFLPVTLGVVLYRGSLDFSVGFPWDPEGRDRTRGWDERAVRLDCRTHCLGYLRQLVVGWPDAVQPMVLLDASRVRNTLDVVLLSDRQHYSGFAAAIKGSRLLERTLGWDRGSPHGVLSRQLLPIEPEVFTSCGICLPRTFPVDYDFASLEATLATWMKDGRTFRIVTEEYLTMEWDGLDQLFVDQSTLSPSGHRKLQGFLAAGGQLLKR